MRWKDLKHKPATIWEMYAVHSVYQGHWTNPVFELFSKTEEGVPTHAHIYITKDKEGSTANRIIKMLPDTIKSFSYEGDGGAHCTICDAERAEPRDYDHNEWELHLQGKLDFTGVFLCSKCALELCDEGD